MLREIVLAVDSPAFNGIRLHTNRRLANKNGSIPIWNAAVEFTFPEYSGLGL